MKFLLGLLAGIVAGLMLAPASGSETRRRISEGANDLAESSRDKMQQVSETAKQKARQVSDLAADKVQQASDYARQKVGGAEAATDAITEKIQRKTA